MTSILFSTSATKATLSRRHRAGRIRRLHDGIYTDDLAAPPERVARDHLWEIVAHVWPGAVVTDRSAFDGRDRDGWLFIAHPHPPRRSDLRLPGVTVSPRPGAAPLDGDMPYPHGLWLAGPARALLENARTGAGRPPKDRPPRTLRRAELEEQIDRLAVRDGEQRLREILVAVERLAPDLGAHNELETVRRLVVAALGTHEDTSLASDRLAARATGEPYDDRRVAMFDALIDALTALAPSSRPAVVDDPRFAWLPFFEAYFSNFIEGTVFEVEEAVDIALHGKVPPTRPEDAHDIAGTYRLLADLGEMRQVAVDWHHFDRILRRRHAVVMAGRPERHPGEYKTEVNRAGAYTFVLPELLIGTMRRGVERLARLVHPFHRSVFVMVLVTECHPFADGNGRVARAMANAELVAGGECRIVVPSVYRSNYLAGLRAVSNGTNPGTSLFDILDFTRRWASRVDWSTYESAMADLEATNGFEDPGIADREGIRLLLP